MEVGGQFVGINVEFGVWGKCFVRRFVILMTFYPLNLEWAAEFFVKVTDDGEVVNVVWLFGGAEVLPGHKGDPVDCDLAVNYPFKFATMSESPVPRNEGDEKKGCCKASQFAAG